MPFFASPFWCFILHHHHHIVLLLLLLTCQSLTATANQYGLVNVLASNTSTPAWTSGGTGFTLDIGTAVMAQLSPLTQTLSQQNLSVCIFHLSIFEIH